METVEIDKMKNQLLDYNFIKRHTIETRTTKCELDFEKSENCDFYSFNNLSIDIQLKFVKSITLILGGGLYEEILDISGNINKNKNECINEDYNENEIINFKILKEPLIFSLYHRIELLLDIITDFALVPINIVRISFDVYNNVFKNGIKLPNKLFFYQCKIVVLNGIKYKVEYYRGLFNITKIWE